MQKSQQSKVSQLRPRLLSWYDQCKRELPWRQRPTPYRVLVSEVMLQQTQVDKVIPYYQRFVKKFPTFRSLARAELDDVLALWSGLGYYSRARNLHRCAQQVASKYKGQLPQDRTQLLTLPGIGPYTAGAVLSIAFDQPAALVDGNVERVLVRLLAITGDPRATEQAQKILQAAEWLVVGERPGDLNQALMELGALVCRPGMPDCDPCPLKHSCLARQQKKQGVLPPPRKRAQRQLLHLAVAVLQSNNAVLLCRRPEQGLFGGLWELPSIEVHGPNTRGVLCKQLEKIVGQPVRVGSKISSTKRTLTHRDMVVDAYPVFARQLSQLPRGARLVPRERLARMGLSSAMRAVLSDAEKNLVRDPVPPVVAHAAGASRKSIGSI